MRALEQLIAEVGVFAGLEPRHLELICGCGRNEHLPGGMLLAREGRSADRFYLIRNGSVALEVHSPGRGDLVIGTLHSGDMLGWSWLFAPYRWRLDVRTIEPVRVIRFDGACLRDKCERDHELGYQLMKRFAALAIERLQATRLQLLDVYANPLTG